MTESTRKSSSSLFVRLTDDECAKEKATFNSSSKKIKTSEEKEYLIVLKCREISQEQESIINNGEAAIIIGRSKAFDYILNIFENDVEMDIDVRNSFVLTEGVPLENRISLYRFVDVCNRAYPESAINIDDYIDDDEEDVENESHDSSIVSGNGYNANQFTLLDNNNN